ncbi:MAG TPA: hypothetical protein VFE18_04800 [Phenylobacterium sp.]|uniref:hypothetical protein n=1 Tax=Phenylobacterium sp. TaxID=1871053 RepID=UPI002D32C351|nr:hypothetical protein [Phenylobacterium sp.]HZZ67472.1 hypothetical protein [Phenylobacterium sp.]
MTSPRSRAWPDRRRAKPSAITVGAAVLGVAAIGFVTLCPIGLRPHLANADVERFGAYLILGLLVSRAAGRRAVGATMLVMALAFGLEAAQRFAPGRHAQMVQALVKAFGGLSGVMAAELVFPLKRLMARLSGLNDPRWVLAPVYVTSR